LLTLREIEVRTIGFTVVSVVCEPYTLVEHVFNGIAVSKPICALQIELAVLDRNPLIATLVVGFVSLIVA
jgi:hypothetical protein